MHVGIPYAPISVPYSLLSQDFGKLKAIIAMLTPGLVFAAERHGVRARHRRGRAGRRRNRGHGEPAGRSTGDAVRRARRRSADGAVDAAHAKVGPDTIAKILFTSGSTGQPKGVINTQRMLCANQAMIRSGFAFVADEPPVLVDWPPWNHTFGGNHDFGLVLDNGGSFYIDEGKPLPGAIEATVRNLRDIAPTIYFNVPKGFEMLLPLSAQRRGIARALLQPAQGAVLRRRGPRPACARRIGAARDRDDRRAHHLSVEPRLDRNRAGSRSPARWESERAGNIGLPLPGVELKLVPRDGKLEARLKGANITPGYWRAPELTAAAFDEEGFTRSAMR